MKFIDFPTHNDGRGRLTVIEGADLPFEIKRVFYIHGVPQGAERAKHAHYQCKQVLVALKGKFTAMIENKRIVLESPDRGLFLMPMTWRELCDFSSDAVCLVLCSEPYDETDYIRNYEDYVGLRDLLFDGRL